MAVLCQDLVPVEGLSILEQIGLVKSDMERQGVIEERLLEIAFNRDVLNRFNQSLVCFRESEKLCDYGELLGIQVRVRPNIEYIRIYIDYVMYPSFEPQEPNKEYGGTVWLPEGVDMK